MSGPRPGWPQALLGPSSWRFACPPTVGAMLLWIRQESWETEAWLQAKKSNVLSLSLGCIPSTKASFWGNSHSHRFACNEGSRGSPQIWLEFQNAFGCISMSLVCPLGTGEVTLVTHELNSQLWLIFIHFNLKMDTPEIKKTLKGVCIHLVYESTFSTISFMNCKCRKSIFSENLPSELRYRSVKLHLIL